MDMFPAPGAPERTCPDCQPSAGIPSPRPCEVAIRRPGTGTLTADILRIQIEQWSSQQLLRARRQATCMNTRKYRRLGDNAVPNASRRSTHIRHVSITITVPSVLTHNVSRTNNLRHLVRHMPRKNRKKYTAVVPCTCETCNTVPGEKIWTTGESGSIEMLHIKPCVAMTRNLPGFRPRSFLNAGPRLRPL